MKRNRPEKEYLENLLNEYGSVGKVASFLMVPYSTIYSWYVSEDIKLPPSCMTIYEHLRSISFSDTQKSVVLGSVLGDGSLLKNKHSKNARLQVGHCTRQLEYLKWKMCMLNPFSTRITLAEKPGAKVICGKSSYCSGYYLANTIAHPDITGYYNSYYFNGRKRVCGSVVEDLTLLSLAIWLADDGSFSMKKNGSFFNLGGSLATNSFSFEDRVVLMAAISKFYRGHISNGRDGVLYFSGSKEINSLIDIVLPILPPEIHYKFAPQRLNVWPLVIKG